eukprot:3638603-Rhodomonas_salina.2
MIVHTSRARDRAAGPAGPSAPTVTLSQAVNRKKFSVMKLQFRVAGNKPRFPVFHGHVSGS